MLKLYGIFKEKSMKNKKKLTSDWFTNLKNKICHEFESIEKEYALSDDSPKFICDSWQRPGGGGGLMSVMRGNIFEKVGVNISTVYGQFSNKFSKEIPGTENSKKFFATGVSIVAHMSSPLVPAVHFNTRFIQTEKSWFGGGGDLTPIYFDESDRDVFHSAFKEVCNRYNPDYYQKFSYACDEYFYLPHRKEARGVGGIFFDYLNNNNFEQDFSFIKDVGSAFISVYPKIVRRKMYLKWTDEQREYQLKKRGRYVEFNLLYDRGTKFGLMTEGNTEAILMSMPPVVKW